MANRLGLWRRLSERIPDWIWPHLTGPPIPGPEDKRFFEPRHAQFFDNVNRTLALRLSEAEHRTKSVETKLLALLALASVLSLAVAAGLTASMSIDNVAKDDRFSSGIAVCLVCYVSIQLFRSLWATVAGLTRKSYKALSAEDMIPSEGESREMHQARLINLQLNHLRWNEWVVDEMVGEMSVAHEGLKNVMRGTFALILLAFAFAMLNLY